MHRVRELWHGEIGELRHSVIRQENDGDGNLQGRLDQRGYEAKAVAMALVKADGSPYFGNPLVEYVTIDQMPSEVVKALFKAVDELSGLTREEKEKLGKPSATTPTKSGS